MDDQEDQQGDSTGHEEGPEALEQGERNQVHGASPNIALVWLTPAADAEDAENALAKIGGQRFTAAVAPKDGIAHCAAEWMPGRSFGKIAGWAIHEHGSHGRDSMELMPTANAFALTRPMRFTLLLRSGERYDRHSSSHVQP
ncbi:hypothetical protein [Sphingobium indicum]|uniref:hypothetical protein n=1 Tax=Sphingobium indicum TaxID=332055 RepID=UPI0005875B4F|nr:hypothetical protein [Sphingobium indicum]